MAKAGVERRLPALRHLDISYNRRHEVQLGHIFDNDCNWEELLSLKIENIGEEMQKANTILVSKIRSGSLQSLQLLRISCHVEENLFGGMALPLKKMHRLELLVNNTQTAGKILEPISVAIDDKLLPALDTVVFTLSTKPAAKDSWEAAADETGESAAKMMISVFDSFAHLLLI